MNYEALKFYLELANLGLTCLVGIYVWITSRNRATNGRISKLETDVDDRLENLSARLIALEERAKHAPTHEDFKRVHERLDKLSEEVGELCGTVKALVRQLDLVNQHLLQARK